MRLKPQVPTAQDAVRHFQDMAHGRLPKSVSRKRKLFGGWGGSGPSLMKTTLVTSTAQALEQAKSELKQKGERLSRDTKTRRSQSTAGKKKKKTTIKGRVNKKKTHSTARSRRVKT